jgi:hypothetical protein
VDISAIAVSKPCCPVCWEVLKILSGDEDIVPTHHRSLTQVELPRWFPLKVVEATTGRFETILRNQIATMMKRRNKQHMQYPSDQSRQDFSSDEDDDDILTDYDEDADSYHTYKFSCLK